MSYEKLDLLKYEHMENIKFLFVVSLIYNFDYTSNIIDDFNKQILKNFKVRFYVPKHLNYLVSLIKQKSTFEYSIVITDKNESVNFNHALSNCDCPYIMFINDNVYFDADFVEKLNKLIVMNQSIYHLLFIEKINKKNKFKYVTHDFDEELTALKAMKLILNEKTIYPLISCYLFDADFLMNNSLQFDTLMEKDNELSFLLRAFYYCTKLICVDNIRVNYDKTSDAKYNFPFPNQLNTRLDAIYVFKLFLHNQLDYDIYRKLFTSIHLFYRLFMLLIRKELSFKKFNFVDSTIFFFKRVYIIFSSYFVYYGGTYTKLIENNKLMLNYDNSYNRKVKYSFVVFCDDCYNEDDNKAFFKNLLNSNVHEFEVILVYKEGQHIKLHNSISYFVRKYNQVFRLYEITNKEDLFDSLFKYNVVKGQYVMFTTNNAIYSHKFLSYVDRISVLDNNPSVITCSFQNISYIQNISKYIKFKKGSIIGNILYQKVYKDDDTYTFNKFYNVALFQKILEKTNIKFSYYNYLELLPLVLNIYSSSSKVCTIKKSLIKYQNFFTKKQVDINALGKCCLAYKKAYRYVLENSYDVETKFKTLFLSYKKTLKKYVKVIYHHKVNRIVNILCEYFNDLDLEDENIFKYLSQLQDNI